MARILFVEDDEQTREAMTKVLTIAGHKVTAVGNGRDALMAVMERQPEVVLLDLVLPELDGPGFLEVVRSYLRLQSLPVVVLTGITDSPMIDRTQSLKVNSILTKAKATSDDILKAIDEALVRMPG